MKTSIAEVRTEKAPAPVGPYSQAVRLANLVFVSGQIPLDPETGAAVEGEIEVQTERVIANLRAVLEAAGSSLERVLRTTIYLSAGPAELEDVESSQNSCDRSKAPA